MVLRSTTPRRGGPCPLGKPAPRGRSPTRKMVSAPTPSAAGATGSPGGRVRRKASRRPPPMRRRPRAFQTSYRRRPAPVATDTGLTRRGVNLPVENRRRSRANTVTGCAPPPPPNDEEDEQAASATAHQEDVPATLANPLRTERKSNGRHTKLQPKPDRYRLNQQY